MLSPTAWKLQRLFHTAAVREPSETSPTIIIRTHRNLTKHHHQNPPEPHQASSPEPSGTSPGICTGSFRNLTSSILLKTGLGSKTLHSKVLKEILEDRNSAWFFHRPHGWPVTNFPPARSVRRRCTWHRQTNTTQAWVDRFCMICTGQTLQSLQLEGMEPYNSCRMRDHRRLAGHSVLASQWQFSRTYCSSSMQHGPRMSKKSLHYPWTWKKCTGKAVQGSSAERRGPAMKDERYGSLPRFRGMLRYVP